MFIDNLIHAPAWYFVVVLSVMVSIVLHELGHGFAAIAQGDDTPLLTGHITWNPLVHMGPLGLGLLCFVGIAFGAMPVNPRKFRHPHGDAMVAFAGPLVNATLAVASLSILATLIAMNVDPTIAGMDPLYLFGRFNVVLAIFNLIPVAPLDGSAIVASFVPAYRDFIRNPANSSWTWLAFGLVFFLAGELFALGDRLASAFVVMLLRI